MSSSVYIIIGIIVFIIIILVVVLAFAIAENPSEGDNNTPKSQYGEACSSSILCDTNLTCIENICKKNSGQICTTSDECIPSLSCINNICSTNSNIVNDILVNGWGAPNKSLTVSTLLYSSSNQEFDYVNLSNGLSLFLTRNVNGNTNYSQIPKDDSNSNYKFFFNIPGNESSKNPIPSYTIYVKNVGFYPVIIVDVHTYAVIINITLFNINLNTELTLYLTSVVYPWTSFFSGSVLSSSWSTPGIPTITVNDFLYDSAQQEFSTINLTRNEYFSDNENALIPPRDFSFYLPKTENQNGRFISQIPKDSSNPNYKFFFNNLGGDITSKNPILFNQYIGKIHIVSFIFTPIIVVNRNTNVLINTITLYNSVRNEHLNLVIVNISKFGHISASWSTFYPAVLND